MIKIITKKQELIRALARYGSNQKQFAGKIGISYFHFNKIINGTASPSNEVAKKITQELGKEFDDLFEIESETGR